MSKTSASRRTFQKVRRDSRPVGTVEADLWRPTNKREARIALRAAEKFDRAGKAKGARNGPLGHVALEVYRALWAAVRYRDGCLCPSITWLQKNAGPGRSREAVVAALRRLKTWGFVAWRRRLEYTGGPRGVRGPQVKQATNAYALGAPAAALDMAERGVTLPADELTRLREKAAALASWRDQAFDFSALGEAFRKLWAGIEQRESTGRSQSRPRDSILRSGAAHAALSGAAGGRTL